MRILTTVTDPAWGVLRDVDLLRSDAWVGVFEQARGGHRVVFGDGGGFSLEPTMRFPLVRWLGSDAQRVLVVDSRNRHGGRNARVFDRDGSALAAFCAGDAIEDVVALSDRLVVTYFDEGVFGDVAPSSEGLAYFDVEGRLLGGYCSRMGVQAVDVCDCYCAVRVDHRTVAFSPYTGFPLVLLKPEGDSQTVVPLPELLHGAGALSMRGPAAYFHSPYTAKGEILCWAPWQGRRPQPPLGLGQAEGHLRGLEQGRFVRVDAQGFSVWVMD